MADPEVEKIADTSSQIDEIVPKANKRGRKKKADKVIDLSTPVSLTMPPESKAIPVIPILPQSGVPIVPSSSQELVYTLHLNLPEQTYKELQAGKIDKVMELVRGIAPLQPRKYESWKEIKPTKKKVAIVGFADSRDLAPYKDDSWEIWGLNSLFEMIDMAHVTRWFEIHDRRIFAIDTNKEIGYGLTRTGQPYLQALAQLSVPVYMVEKYDDIPNSIRYPLEDMITEFDPKLRKLEWSKPFSQSADLDWNGYFTNSVSYMIALAIHDGYEEIGIWGVDMATSQGGIGGEYAVQRPSCEYYIGIAQGKGIKITIPDEADLLKTRFIYGFEMMKDLAFSNKLRKINEAMNGRFATSQQNAQLAQKQIDQYIGAIEASKELDKIWRNCAYGKDFEQVFDKFILSQTVPKVST